jgi:transcription termination/antitermination protein NusG
VADERNKRAEEAMINEPDVPVADDAVTNRSDDTALDDADAQRAGEQDSSLTPSAGDESTPMNEESDAVGPATEEQEAYQEAAEAEDAEAEGDTDVEGEAAADEAEVEEAAVVPARPRGPVHEEPQVEEEIRMDWYILKVQSNRERTIAEALERKMRVEGLDRFFDQVIVPTEKVTEFKGGKKKVVERKLYPGYIVVHMHINDDTWFAVRETSGVGDFTGAGGKPTPMLPQEVAKIIQTEEEETSETPKLDIRFAKGDKVKVKEGNFESFEGEVNTIDEASGRVTVMINIFGRSTPVELEYWQIEAV